MLFRSNLLSAVTKGYGDTSAEAVQKAADLSFATVRLGQTTFPELAAAMGKVIPLASTLGVEQEQLFRRHGHPDRRNRIHRGSSDPAKGYYAGLPIAVQEHERGPAKHGL